MKFLGCRGAEARSKVLERLSPPDRAMLTGVLPTSLYPAELLTRLDEAIAKVLAQGNTSQLLKDMGRFSAETNLGPGGAQRPYLRPGEVHFFLGNVPRMYSWVHESGRRTYAKTGERSAVICTLDGDPPHPGECLTTAGWLEAGIALSGGRDAAVSETLCRAEGAAHCEFHCSWA